MSSLDYQSCPSAVLGASPDWSLPVAVQDATVETATLWGNIDGSAAIDPATYPAWLSLANGHLNYALPLDSKVAAQLQLPSATTATTPLAVDPSLESLQPLSQFPDETDFLPPPNDTSHAEATRIRKTAVPVYSTRATSLSRSAPKLDKPTPRQKNIVAGREARRKRRREEDGLKEAIRSMMEKRDEMLDEERELREELQALRSQMRMHQGCGPPCRNLQKYWENTRRWDQKISQLSSCGLALMAEGRDKCYPTG